MAKTGETRKTKQPLKIDRLPSEVVEAILFLRNERGLTWEEIEERSHEPYTSRWRGGGGFIDWAKLDARVLALFPVKKLPKSNLQRWWDLRVTQVQANVERMAVQAREIGQVFARPVKGQDKDSVVSAARDILLGILAEDGTVRGRAAVASALLDLAGVMEQGVANKIRERTVAINERKVQALLDREEAAKKKLDAEAEKMKRKTAKGKVTPEDIEGLYERVFGPRPKAAA